MKKALSVFLAALALVFLPVPVLAAALNAAAITNGLAYLDGQQGADGKIAGTPGTTAWAVRAYAAAGVDPDSVSVTGGQSLLQYLAGHPAEPVFGSASASDWARDVLALTEAGENPYTFGGTDYVANLKTFHLNNQLGNDTVVSDDYFGVQALVAANVANSDAVLTDSLAFILAHQRPDGGFSWSTDAATAGSDVDDTAAALMALTAAQDAGLNPAGLEAALASARAYLLAHQNSDGGFMSDPAFGTDSTVGSTAWAVLALKGLGDDTTAAGQNAQSYLRAQQQSDGSYLGWSGTGDTYNTTNAVFALAAATPVEGPAETPAPSPAPTPSPSPTPTPTPAPAPSVSPSPSPSPAAGTVLGAATGGTGAASGGVLPAVGELSNFTLLMLALATALTAGVVTYIRRRS